MQNSPKIFKKINQHPMKKLLFLALAAGMFTFVACESKQEKAAEAQADQVEESTEAQADAMEDAGNEAGADAVEDAGEAKADSIENAAH